MAYRQKAAARVAGAKSGKKPTNAATTEKTNSEKPVRSATNL